MRVPRCLRRCVPVLFLLAAVIAPAGTIQVVGALTHEYDVTPGGSYTGTIVVQNPEKFPQEVRVYQTDYLFYADGASYYGDPGTMPRSSARWISFTPKQFKLPAAEEAAVRYTIQVPDDARLRGTYWSVIMVEPVEPDSPESSAPASKEKVTVGVRQVFRFAVQIVTHAPGGTRQLKFAKVQVATKDGKRQLLVDAENTGERWLRGTPWVELYARDGALVGKFDGTRLRMYPGTSVRYPVDLGGVLPGSYKALIVIDCGGDDVFGANVNLVLAQ
jgi:hypothetical protein